jgi:N6-L-threonylcarbamoyladenine synthase
MGYDYPGGPFIEKLALTGKQTYNLPLPKNDKTLDFSFSGLKSEVKRIFNNEKGLLNNNDLSFSLQSSIAKILSKKMVLALKEVNPKSVIIGGGVIANKHLRSNFISTINNFDEKINIFIPKHEYCTDNAAMIGMLAYYKIK